METPVGSSRFKAEFESAFPRKRKQWQFYTYWKKRGTVTTNPLVVIGLQQSTPAYVDRDLSCSQYKDKLGLLGNICGFE